MVQTRSQTRSQTFLPTTYYKITNKNECHHKFQYKDGLNIDTNEFQEEGSCVPNGLYFSDKEVVVLYFSANVGIKSRTFP